PRSRLVAVVGLASSLLPDSRTQNCQYKNSLGPPKKRIPVAAMTDIPNAHGSEGLHSNTRANLIVPRASALTPSAGSYRARICSVFGKTRTMNTRMRAEERRLE